MIKALHNVTIALSEFRSVPDDSLKDALVEAFSEASNRGYYDVVEEIKRFIMDVHNGHIPHGQRLDRLTQIRIMIEVEESRKPAFSS